MKPNLAAILLCCIMTVCLGCGALNGNRQAIAGPDMHERVEAVLKYYRELASFPPERIQQEYELHARKAEEANCSEDLIQAGMALSLTPVASWPVSMNADMLRPCLDAPDLKETGMGSLVLILHNGINEKRVLIRRFQSVAAQLKKESDLLEKERHQNEVLRLQLEELKAIEKSIHERERSQKLTGQQE